MELTPKQQEVAKETPLSITSTGNEAIYAVKFDDTNALVKYHKSQNKEPELVQFNAGDKLRLISVGCKPNKVGEFTLFRYGVWGVVFIDVQWMYHVSGSLGDRVTTSDVLVESTGTY